jgi:hypothetical protein
MSTESMRRTIQRHLSGFAIHTTKKNHGVNRRETMRRCLDCFHQERGKRCLASLRQGVQVSAEAICSNAGRLSAKAMAIATMKTTATDKPAAIVCRRGLQIFLQVVLMSGSIEVV